MTRPDGGWVPDGRAKAILADCEASLAALDGLAIDLYLIHAPDPRTPWRTSVRALARLVDEGLVRRVGLANVNRAPAGRGARARPGRRGPGRAQPLRRPRAAGRSRRTVRRAGIAVIAHSPLGGPRGGARPERWPTSRARGRLRPRSRSPGCSSSPRPSSRSPARGARRPRARPRAPRAPARRDERSARRRSARRVQPAPSAPPRATARSSLVMGIPGAGKSRVAEELVARGYLRLNRDERGGSLRDSPPRSTSSSHRACGGSSSTTRTSRARRGATSIEAAAPARGRRRVASGSTRRSPRRRSTSSSGCSTASARCRRPRSCGRCAKLEPGLLAPTSQMRALRELEPPSTDEGFAGVEHVAVRALRRRPRGRRLRRRRRRWRSPAGSAATADRDAPHLVFDWRPDGSRTRSPTASPPRRRGRRAGRGRAVPAPRRPADLLVPAAAARAAARVRASARRRSLALGPRRKRPRPPDARDDARRPLRPGLSQSSSAISAAALAAPSVSTGR